MRSNWTQCYYLRVIWKALLYGKIMTLNPSTKLYFLCLNSFDIVNASMGFMLQCFHPTTNSTPKRISSKKKKFILNFLLMKDVKYNCLKNRSKVKKWSNYRRFDVIFQKKKGYLEISFKVKSYFFLPSFKLLLDIPNWLHHVETTFTWVNFKLGPDKESGLEVSILTCLIKFNNDNK